MRWSQAIKEFRRSRLLKQEALAREIGVDRSRISRWENGLEEPSPAVQVRLRALMSAKTPSVDGQLRLIVETTPHFMQLMLPCTRVVAASRAFAEFAKSDVTELVGLFDVSDMSERLVAEFDRFGGVRHVHENVCEVQSYDVWPKNGSTNKCKTVRIESKAIRLALDDGAPIMCVSTRILAGGERLGAIAPQWSFG